MKDRKSRKFFDVLGRKKIMVALIILIVLLMVTTVKLIVEAIKDNETKNIVYTESSFVDYNVHLKKNDFFESEFIGKDNQYIATLIDFVGATFRYDLKASESNMKHKYTYRIVAETKVEDISNKNTIYKFSEELLKGQELEFNTNKKLEIRESLKIDYNKYNDIIERFINVYTLDDINSTVTVSMYVDVDGVTQAKVPVSSLVIPLTTKTMAIDIESNSVNATELSVYKEIANKNNLYIAILTAILTVMITIELFIFMNDTKDDSAIYKMKVKKILMNYDSYIQKINNDFNFEGYQLLEMKSFEDLLQIRDTIAQPILMIEKVEGNETDFFIPSKENVIYIYKLTLEDIKKEDKKHSTKKG